MPKVRIVDPQSGFRLSLPLPYRLFVNMFVRRSLVLNILEGRLKGLIDQHLRCLDSDEAKKHQLETDIRRLKTLCILADTFDYGELRYALTNTAQYKGLVLVDIQAADGTIVHVTL